MAVFSIPFVIQTNASGVGIGVSLLQDEKPFAYVNKALSPRKPDLSTYEKKLWTLVHAIEYRQLENLSQ